MFFFFSKTLDVFLSPLTWVLFLLVFSAVKSSGLVRKASAFAFVLLTLCSSPIVAMQLLSRLERAQPDSFRSQHTYDAVIVLGGLAGEDLSTADHSPQLNDNVERLVSAHRLLRDGKARRAILSGGTPTDGRPITAEAVLLGQLLEQWGIASDRFTIEPRSLNTRENALFTAEILRRNPAPSLLLITSAYHMVRSAGCFRAVGLTFDTLAVDRRATATNSELAWFPRANALQVTTMVLREKAGWWIYRLRGWVR